MAGQRQSNLNRMNLAAKRAGLGDALADAIDQINRLTVAHNALCAKLDAANVAGIGNNNVAQAGVLAAPVLTLENRPTTT